MSDEYQRIEVITGEARRRHWTTEQKLQILEESFLPGESVSSVARRRGVAELAVSLAPADDGGSRGGCGLFGQRLEISTIDRVVGATYRPSVKGMAAHGYCDSSGDTESVPLAW